MIPKDTMTQATCPNLSFVQKIWAQQQQKIPCAESCAFCAQEALLLMRTENVTASGVRLSNLTVPLKSCLFRYLGHPVP